MKVKSDTSSAAASEVALRRRCAGSWKPRRRRHSGLRHEVLRRAGRPQRPRTATGDALRAISGVRVRSCKARERCEVRPADRGLSVAAMAMHARPSWPFSAARTAWPLLLVALALLSEHGAVGARIDPPQQSAFSDDVFMLKSLEAMPGPQVGPEPCPGPGIHFPPLYLRAQLSVWLR
eukprot:scaffold6036_cov371-Prasinococcus_capsulatus_cf.AAC.10